MGLCRHITSHWSRRFLILYIRAPIRIRPRLREERPDNPYAQSPGDPRFPYVLTTYRLTEHHTAGGMSRTLSHLAELQPELFCEVSPELASEIGLQHGAFATITTPRGIIEARVLVTNRMQPLSSCRSFRPSDWYSISLRHQRLGHG